MMRLAPLVGLLAAAGCGPSTATVAGKVTYQGKPVVWGSVTVQAADGSVHQAPLEPDGTYRLANVPTGPAKAGVNSPNPRPSARAVAEGSPPGPQPPPGAWFPLPDRFADPNTSGLTLTVGGPGDLELK